MIEVKNIEERDAVQSPAEGELVKVGEHQYFTYHDGAWQDTEVPKMSINLYEANKQIYSKQTPLTSAQIRSKLKDYLYDIKVEYYLLLNNELKYYTVFHKGNGSNYKTILEEMYELLTIDFESITHIEKVDKALEIWGTFNGGFGLFMLFDYTQGVIECQ